MTLNEHCTCCFSKYNPLLRAPNNTIFEYNNLTHKTKLLKRQSSGDEHLKCSRMSSNQLVRLRGVGEGVGQLDCFGNIQSCCSGVCPSSALANDIVRAMAAEFVRCPPSSETVALEVETTQTKNAHELVEAFVELLVVEGEDTIAWLETSHRVAKKGDCGIVSCLHALALISSLSSLRESEI
jgi:hypothetical protein